MSAAEHHLGRLVQELESPGLDPHRIEAAFRGLDESLRMLSQATPRPEIDRVLALHAALRVLVERRHAETARSLESVTRTRARMARLTRPGEGRSSLDLDA